MHEGIRPLHWVAGKGETRHIENPRTASGPPQGEDLYPPAEELAPQPASDVPGRIAEVLSDMV